MNGICDAMAGEIECNSFIFPDVAISRRPVFFLDFDQSVPVKELAVSGHAVHLALDGTKTKRD